MTRVMLITFAVLGWAWFEMSGGTDFEAGSNGVTLMAEVRPTVQRYADAPRAEPVVEVAEAAPALVSDEGAEQVTRRETSVLGAIVQPASFPSPTVSPLEAEAEKVAALQTPTVMSDAVTAPEPMTLERVDYRTVTASRVNLRGGPSTSYDVITQLLRGEDVEVLDDTGDGWVKLRALDGSDIGWMADSFLTVAN